MELGQIVKSSTTFSTTPSSLSSVTISILSTGSRSTSLSTAIGSMPHIRLESTIRRKSNKNSADFQVRSDSRSIDTTKLRLVCKHVSPADTTRFLPMPKSRNGTMRSSRVVEESLSKTVQTTLSRTVLLLRMPLLFSGIMTSYSDGSTTDLGSMATIPTA